MPKVVKAVHERVQRNLIRCQSTLACEMKISNRSVFRILNEDLGLNAYKHPKGKILNVRLRNIRLTHAKALLKRFGRRGSRKSSSQMRKSSLWRNITNRIPSTILTTIVKFVRGLLALNVLITGSTSRFGRVSRMRESPQFSSMTPALKLACSIHFTGTTS